MKYLLIFTSLFFAFQLSAQQKVILDQVEDIERMASKEFEMAMAQPEGSLYLFGQENTALRVYTLSKYQLEIKIKSLQYLCLNAKEVTSRCKIK